MVGRIRIGTTLVLVVLLAACASTPSTPVAARMEPELPSTLDDGHIATAAPTTPVEPEPVARAETSDSVMDVVRPLSPDIERRTSGLDERGAIEANATEEVVGTAKLLELQTEIVTSYQNFRYGACIAAALELTRRDDAGDLGKNEALIMAGAAAYLQGDFFLSRMYFRGANRYVPHSALDARYFPLGMRDFYRESLAGPPE